MRLGIYGGTFAPPHNAHVRAAEIFQSELSLDKLMVIPAGIPPHKSISEDDSPAQRLEMCRLAFSHIPNVEISDMELRRSGKSYTVMTVRELWNERTELFLLCGTDMMLTFDGWYCFREIMEKCTLVCIRREDDEKLGAELENKIDFFKDSYGAKIRMLNAPALELSSTLVRQTLTDNRDASGLIPESVLSYITEHGLYRNK